MSSENNEIVWIDFDNFPHVLFFNQIIIQKIVILNYLNIAIKEVKVD